MLNSLANFDADTFLSEYWQRKPCVIRGAFSQWENPLPADELAGLSCEIEGFESLNARLVLSPSPEQQQDTNAEWKVELGPFTIDRFDCLAKANWTLLVDAVDTAIPEVAALREAFNFIPSWRFDDVMVSYATRGGSVGPHFDRYDVFLLQGAGSREWRIGQNCDSESALQQNQPLTLLAEFEQQDVYRLNPGDILYLPPQLAHWGIALDSECMTYSIGFRAPSFAEVLEDFAHAAAYRYSEDQRYRDPANARTTAVGEIGREALAEVSQILNAAAHDEQFVAEWFGRLVTRRTAADLDATNGETEECAQDDVSNNCVEFSNLNAFREAINQAESIFKALDTRCAYLSNDALGEASNASCSLTDANNASSNSTIRFFLNGQCYNYSSEWSTVIATLCRDSQFAGDSFELWLNEDESAEQLMKWFNRGYFYIDDEP